MTVVRILAAPDKFKGTATAREVAAAIGRAATSAGYACDEAPVADGGEGTIDSLGGANRWTSVTGPLGEPVRAAWRLDGSTAVIEMAEASGLVTAGGPEANDPIAATTIGTGELIAAAITDGATRIIVGVGGSATTDGGTGALRALGHIDWMPTTEIIVACDVRTTFVDAATDFAPQKGATPGQVALLSERLDATARRYLDDYGVDVRTLTGGGAAGGLAGGLAAIGARLVGGFDLIAAEIGFDRRLDDADLVITGEGRIDARSFDGKVVGEVAARAATAGRPVVAIAGEVAGVVADRVRSVSLVERFGRKRATHETVHCVEEAALDAIHGALGR